MSDENELITEFVKTNESLNKCIEDWYQDNFPENLKDDKLNEYKGCCDDTEMNLLVECYHIFSNKGKPENSKKNKKQSLDKDFIKALIAYYYYMMVLEHYIFIFIDEKYLKIDKIIKITDYITDIPEDNSVIRNINGHKIRVNKNTMLLKDNQSNWYNFVLYPTDKDKTYVLIHNIVDTANNIYNPYVILKENGKELLEQQLEGKYKYIYQKQSETGKLIKVLAREHLSCFDDYHTEKSKQYFELLYKSPSEKIIWISQIRRKILHMNTELFEGYQGGKRRNVKKYTKKNKKQLQKTRKNTGKKRM